MSIFNLIPKLADWFSESDYSEERRQMVDRYAKSRAGMVGPSDLPHATAKRAEDGAMRLVAGNTYQIDEQLFRVSIHDKNDGTRFDPPVAPFVVQGSTKAQAEERARQLISALDGARRL